jgi:type II secretion system protein N
MNTAQQGLSQSHTNTESLSVFKKLLLGFLFVFLLLFFTLTKLPQAKITGLIQGVIQKSLDPYGIYISDQGRELSIWKGFQYRLIQPSIELPDLSRIELDSLVISPKLSSLLTGKIGAEMEIIQNQASLTFDGTIRGDLVDGTLVFNSIDLGKFGILSFIGGIKGSGLINGSLHLDGHLADLPSLAGMINLNLRQLHLDEQNLFGFHLPDMNIKEGVIDASIQTGKVQLKQFMIGKGADDLQITLSGEIGLNKNINSSFLNLRALIGLSDKVKQSIPLLDTILGSAKQGDGSYAYKLTGPLFSPMPVPDPKK